MPRPPPSGPLCTVSSLIEDIAKLGIHEGDTILLHSSLSSIGWVCGGSESVVRAFLEVLGSTGTLVVPTYTGENSDPAQWSRPPVPQEWWQVIRDNMPPFDVLTSRSRQMGVIAETVRCWPAAKRSAHPQTSFAAVGALADEITANHPLDCSMGEHSPMAKLEKLNAKVVLLGVGYKRCSAFHLGEYRIGCPLVDNSFAAGVNGHRQWVTVKDVAFESDDFGQIGRALDESHEIIIGSVGTAETRVFSLESAVARATQWLSANREISKAEARD